MSQLLENLNPDQQSAVTYVDGPLLILAGAGSGKTRTLTHRAAYLLEETKLQPHQIILLTFTNKAAQEMQQRIYSLVGQQLPFAGTFHSFSAKMLRMHGHHIGIGNDYLIYDASDQLDVIKRILKQLPDSDIKPRTAIHQIEQIKQQLLSPSEYATYAQGHFQQQIAQIYRQYQTQLNQAVALDFNDLLIQTIRLLSSIPSIKQQYQSQFIHVLIDEYQDTNKAQYRLTKLLTLPQQNLCAVGDASQAIYSWRGADYRNLKMLTNDFPSLKTIRLEQNYRSTANIIAAADAVIQNNNLHPILELWTDQDAGQPIQIIQYQDEYQEANQILDIIQADGQFQHHAILYRTNAQSRIFEEQCIRRGIPYRLIGGTRFYDRKEVKDVLCYIRYAFNPKDQVSYDRAIKIGKRMFAKFDIWRQQYDPNLTPAQILEQVLTVTNYLAKYDPQDPNDLARIENVQELASVAQSFSTLGDFLENIALVENETSPTSDSQHAITLMTLHASKGLEFPHIYLIGMEEGLFPHSRTMLDKEQLEEERRLCYVGITRAMTTLTLSHVNSRLYFGTRSSNQPSRFLQEIPSHLTTGASANKQQAPISDELLDAFLNDEIDIDEFLK